MTKVCLTELGFAVLKKSEIPATSERVGGIEFYSMEENEKLQVSSGDSGVSFYVPDGNEHDTFRLKVVVS